MSDNNRKVTIQGTIHLVGETKNISDNFSVKDIVVKVTEVYGNGKTKEHLIPIQFSNARISEVDSAKVGTGVEVQAEITGREWQGKFFPQLSGWTCKATFAPTEPTAEETPKVKSNVGNPNFLAGKQQGNVEYDTDGDDSLPF